MGMSWLEKGEIWHEGDEQEVKWERGAYRLPGHKPQYGAGS